MHCTIVKNQYLSKKKQQETEALLKMTAKFPINIKMLILKYKTFNFQLKVINIRMNGNSWNLNVFIWIFD